MKRKFFLHPNKKEEYSTFSRKHWSLVTKESWQILAPPFRPSKEEIVIYKKELQKIPKVKHILVLGATPELRDLVASLELGRYVVADQSEKMLTTMSQLLHVADPLEEIWVKGNWTTLSLKQGFFDAIIGDLVLRQLLPEEQSAFLSIIKKLLTQDGVFVTRVQYARKEVRLGRGKLIQDFLDEAKGEYDHVKVCLFISELLNMSALSSKRRLSYANAKNVLETFTEQTRNVNDKLLISRILRRFFVSGLDMAYQDKKELFQLFQSHFQIIEVQNATDYPVSKYYPIITFKKQKVEFT